MGRCLYCWDTDAGDCARCVCAERPEACLGGAGNDTIVLIDKEKEGQQDETPSCLSYVFTLRTRYLLLCRIG